MKAFKQVTENAAFIVDPTDSFASVSMNQCIETCGILPHWALHALHQSAEIGEFMEGCYGFPIYEMEGGEVEQDGTYTYPGDPKLPPIMVLYNGEKEILIYQYAIVAWRDRTLGAPAFVTRMD